MQHLASNTPVPPERGADAKHGGETAIAPITSFGTDKTAPLSLRDIPPFGGNLLDGYLQYCQVTKRLSTRIVEIYTQELGKLSALCQQHNTPLLDVQNAHIRRWIAAAHASGLALGTIALQLSSWRGLYKWLVDNRHMTHNPCIGIKAPKAAKPLPKALGVDAAVALAELKSESALNQLIVELLYGSGLRVSELVGLDIVASQEAVNAGRGWIDSDSNEIHVHGKGSKRRMVPLGGKAKIALAQYLPARSAQLITLGKAASLEAALMLGPKGLRLTRQAVWGLLRKRSLAAGLDTPVHPHMLRHSFASHVLQSSGDLRAVQELLGHSSIASTQVYTRLDFQHLAKIYDNAHPRAKLPPSPLSLCDIPPLEGNSQ